MLGLEEEQVVEISGDNPKYEVNNFNFALIEPLISNIGQV